MKSTKPHLAEEPVWKQLQNRCTHFSGLMNERCDVGVRYEDVAAPPEDPADPRFGILHRLPCFTKDGLTHRCAQARFLTDEEAHAEEAAIRDGFAEMWRKIDAGICPNHNTPMTLKQIGRCVYADPCGCRLYQGRIDRKVSDEERVPTTKRQVAPVDEPDLEKRAARTLARCVMVPGTWDKRFSRDLNQRLQTGGTLTEKQRHWLWTLVQKYRRQIADAELLAAAEARGAA